MNTVTSIPIERLRYRPAARQRSDDALVKLEESIGAIGLLNPPRVRPIADGYEIVAGAHRVQACDALGWHEVPCIITDDDDITAELAMIAENLHRAELSALERSEQVARWAELNAMKVSQVATPLGGRQPEYQGVRAAERDLGIKKDDAARSMKVASLSPEAKQAARDVGLDNNRSALLQAARQPTPAAQVQALQERKAGGIAARFAPASSPSTVTSRVFNRFVALVDELEALAIPELVQAAGRQRSVLGQRASGLADRMGKIMEALQ